MSTQSPSIQFDVSSVSTEGAIAIISHLTNTFQMLKPEFVHELLKKLFTRGYAHYGVLLAPCNVEVNRQIVGLGGKYLRLTTERSGTDFIWHDKNKNAFVFIGGHREVIRAMYTVNHRIQICSERFYQENAGSEADLTKAGSEADLAEAGSEADLTEAESVKLDCFYCMKHSECSLKKCAGCNVARYCDQECQKADWSSHKTVCRV
jgi:hypothetical protein